MKNKAIYGREGENGKLFLYLVGPARAGALPQIEYTADGDFSEPCVSGVFLV